MSFIISVILSIAFTTVVSAKEHLSFQKSPFWGGQLVHQKNGKVIRLVCLDKQLKDACSSFQFVEVEKTPQGEQRTLINPSVFLRAEEQNYRILLKEHVLSNTEDEYIKPFAASEGALLSPPFLILSIPIDLVVMPLTLPHSLYVKARATHRIDTLFAGGSERLSDSHYNLNRFVLNHLNPAEVNSVRVNCGDRGTINERISNCAHRRPTRPDHVELVSRLGANKLEVIRDVRTGLFWSGYAEAKQSKNEVIFQDALNACAKMSKRVGIPGLHWRIPTVEEFEDAFINDVHRFFPRILGNSHFPVAGLWAKANGGYIVYDDVRNIKLSTELYPKAGIRCIGTDGH